MDIKNNFFTRFYAKHPILSHLVLIVLAALVLGWLSLQFLRVWTRHGAVATVPETRSMTSEQARAILEKEGFKVEISDSIYIDSVAPGIVSEQWPKPGAVVKPGREVFLTVTARENRMVAITFPIINESSRQVLANLESIGVRNVHIEYVPGQYKDAVVNAIYKNAELRQGMRIPVNSRIDLKISNGLGSDADGLTEEEIIEENAEAGMEHTTPAPAQEPDPDDPYQSSFYD